MTRLILLLAGCFFVFFIFLKVLIKMSSKGPDVQGVPLEGAEPEGKKSLSPSQTEESDPRFVNCSEQIEKSRPLKCIEKNTALI